MRNLTSRMAVKFFVLLFFCFTSEFVWSQAKPIAIVGATLIDGTGRPPLTDAAVVMQDGRFTVVGKRADVSLPQEAEVIDAKGKTILPGTHRRALPPA
jgi:imidazolonepropionase-like amidohydrolase